MLGATGKIDLLNSSVLLKCRKRKKNFFVDCLLWSFESFGYGESELLNFSITLLKTSGAKFYCIFPAIVVFVDISFNFSI